MTSLIDIAGRAVGPGQPAFVIAEVAQSHDGSLGMAHAFIDTAAESGADAIKFQTHIAAAESTFDEEFRVKFSRQDESRFDYWRRMEFSPAQWAGLARHAAEQGIVFLSSAFSVAAVELLRELGLAAWKVGSGEYRSEDLWQAMAVSGAPILLSTGMSEWREIEAAVERVGELGVPLALFQCTSRYPTALAEVGLNVIDELRCFGCPVGLSDHSGSVHPSLAALARGADLIEVHLTLDRRLFGPDVPVSLTPPELSLICEARDALVTMEKNPVDKDAMAAELAEMRGLFSKSLAPVRPLSAGTRLSADMLTAKKPGTGIPAAELDDVVGRRLTIDVGPERLLRREDLDG
ncbi:MAG: N-acetylneuraminate synthase family protein [Alphaproteobacteria bacterium]|jgi:N-acetylneuraminate synthase|nr:N-acetylneuraminate synthase family protein [Alphaproteobacteria bacterium]